MKKSITAYLLLALCLIGFCGFNRFYLGKIGTGILWFFTFGLFGFGLIYDLFTIPSQVRMANLLSGATMQNHQNQNQNVVVNVHNVVPPVTPQKETITIDQ